MKRIKLNSFLLTTGVFALLVGFGLAHSASSGQAHSAGSGQAQTTVSAGSPQAEPVFPGKVQTTPIPAEFTDPETGLRVVHLSRFPSDYGSVIYFTYNTFSADSDLALVNAQYKDKWRHLYTFDFGTMAVSALVTNQLTQNQVVVAKSGHVYYQADHAVWVVPLRGGAPRKLCELPLRWFPGTGFTVNADETLLLGGSSDLDRAEAARLGAEASRNGPNVIFTVSLKTGELKIIHRDNHWFGHAQFSPADPDLAMFCHEGNWEKVDRIWFINPSKSVTDAAGKVISNARIAYHRAEPCEIVGHEFWHPNGKTIWFQQAYRKGPKQGTGFLTSMEVATGRITQYTIPDGFGGIHETFSPDGTFMVADGSGKGKTGPGKYISKLAIPTDGSTVLKAEHLVSLQVHDYAVEPNPHVSPDNRWVMFTAMLHGTPQAYAVELPTTLSQTPTPGKSISPSNPVPTYAEVPYGGHQRQVLDFWKAPSAKPTPLVFHIHGGGWVKGDKGDVRSVAKYLAAGISVVSVNYRYIQQAQLAGVKPPVEWPMHDVARALQFVRSKASEWNIDRERIGATGGSAGACSSLWLALHKDMADPKSSDPIARESTRLWCAAVSIAQTSLDPRQMKEWTPNMDYGGHAFGFWDPNNLKTRDTRFADFLQHREELLPWIREYSPIEHASADDPPVYLFYGNTPGIGKSQKDPKHNANFGMKLQEKLKSLGVECELVYPGAPGVKHTGVEAFLVERLKE